MHKQQLHVQRIINVQLKFVMAVIVQLVVVMVGQHVLMIHNVVLEQHVIMKRVLFLYHQDHVHLMQDVRVIFVLLQLELQQEVALQIPMVHCVYQIALALQDFVILQIMQQRESVLFL